MTVQPVTYYRAHCDGCTETIGCDDDYGAWNDADGALLAAELDDGELVIRRPDDLAESVVVCTECLGRYLDDFTLAIALASNDPDGSRAVELDGLRDHDRAAIIRLEAWLKQRAVARADELLPPCARVLDETLAGRPGTVCTRPAGHAGGCAP